MRLLDSRMSFSTVSRDPSASTSSSSSNSSGNCTSAPPHLGGCTSSSVSTSFKQFVTHGHTVVRTQATTVAAFAGVAASIDSVGSKTGSMTSTCTSYQDSSAIPPIVSTSSGSSQQNRGKRAAVPPAEGVESLPITSFSSTAHTLSTARSTLHTTHGPMEEEGHCDDDQRENPQPPLGPPQNPRSEASAGRRQHHRRHTNKPRHPGIATVAATEMAHGAADPASHSTNMATSNLPRNISRETQDGPASHAAFVDSPPPTSPARSPAQSGMCSPLESSRSGHSGGKPLAAALVATDAPLETVNSPHDSSTDTSSISHDSEMAKSQRGGGSGGGSNRFMKSFDELLSANLSILKKVGKCANHVWICKHTSLPSRMSFVVKLAKVKRSLVGHRRDIWGRHLAILRAKPTPDSCVVNVLGCCRASLNELNAHPDLRSVMEPDRQDEPCLFMVVERLPGTLLDFWLQYDERRYCVFTASSFLRDLLRVCLWLEENSLYLYDFKLENFFVRADGRLVLGDLDTVFAVNHDRSSRFIYRNHSPETDGIYNHVDIHPMPFQAPEVRMACERLNADKHHAEVVDYTKAHTWSCAAMIYYYLSGCVMPVGAKFNDRVLDRYLRELQFLQQTADPRTNDQGVYISQVLSHMLDPDASVRWDTPTALKAVEARFVEEQFAVDFDAKYRAEWEVRSFEA